MEKILILGAGIAQLSLIKKAKSLGLYVIVSSIRGNYPGFKFADKVYYEDTTNMERILRIAQQENINAIITAGTDVAVKTVGYVCDKLNLPGVSFDVARISTDKALMKEALVKGKVKTASFVVAKTLEDAKTACRMIGFPVMFKCVDKSGSRGIIKVNQTSEIEKSYQYAYSFTEKDYIVIEKFIGGTEIGMDGYVGDDTEIFMPYQRIPYSNGYTDIPFRHGLPMIYASDQVKNAIYKEAKKAVHAIGLKNSFFNMDLIITEEGEPYIVELGARIGGVFIPEMLSMYYDIDIHKQIILSAFGKHVEFQIEDKDKVCLSELLISEQDGVIENIKMDSYALNELGQVYLSYKKGDVVRKFRNGADAIGGLVAVGKDFKEAEGKLEKMKQNISLAIKTMQ